MGTFYGYAERDAGSYVDWSQIGKDITDMLQEEVVRRETLKKELEDASTAYGETLANAPTGMHKGATDFITNFAGDATSARLMQDRLLKSGQLKVKDYLLQRENLKQGTKGVFTVAKKFQEEFGRKAERMSKEESMKLEQTLFKMTEGFANFNNSGVYINPTNFQVSIAKKEMVEEKPGEYIYKMGEKPQDFFTINELNNFVSLDLNRFDVESKMDDIAKRFGVREQTIQYFDKASDQYKTISIADATSEVVYKNLSPDQQKLVDSYKEAERREIANILANKYNASSVLTDYVGNATNGKPYDFTFDPEVAKNNEEMILLEKDPASGIPAVKLTKSQEEHIGSAISTGIKQRLDQKYLESGVQVKRPTPPRTYDPKNKRDRDGAKKQITSYSVWLKELIEGDPDTKKLALQKFANRNPENVKTLEFEEVGGVANLVAVMKDGSRRTMLNDWERSTNQEIADALMFNKTVPTVSDQYQVFYDEMIEATGVLDVAKRPVYQYLDPNKPGLYTSQTSDMYLRSTPTKEAYISMDDMVITKTGATGSTKPTVAWGKLDKFDSLNDETNSRKFIDNVEETYLGNFYDKNTAQERNPFKATIKGMQRVDYNKLPDMYKMGREYDNILFKIDPKYGESFVLPVSQEIQTAMPDIMKVVQSGLIDGADPFTREDIINAAKGVSKIRGYNDAYDKNIGFTSGAKKPFRPYDPSLDASLADYKAKKDAYENQ